MLVELSQHTNTKLHVVAQSLVDDTLHRAGNRVGLPTPNAAAVFSRVENNAVVQSGVLHTIGS